MQVGRMRYRIEIQDYKSTQDADGFETREWMTVHTVWADIAPVSGKEYMAYDRKGVPNPLKAAVLEHGRSNQPAKPWAKPAGRKAKKECIKKMQEALDSEVEKL